MGVGGWDRLSLNLILHGCACTASSCWGREPLSSRALRTSFDALGFLLLIGVWAVEGVSLTRVFQAGWIVRGGSLQGCLAWTASSSILSSFGAKGSVGDCAGVLVEAVDCEGPVIEELASISLIMAIMLAIIVSSRLMQSSMARFGCDGVGGASDGDVLVRLETWASKSRPNTLLLFLPLIAGSYSCCLVIATKASDSARYSAPRFHFRQSAAFPNLEKRKDPNLQRRSPSPSPLVLADLFSLHRQAFQDPKAYLTDLSLLTKLLAGKAKTLGRMIKSVVEFSGYDVSYQLRMTINAQTLVEFVKETTLLRRMKENSFYMLMAPPTSRVGIVLTSLEADELEHTLGFEFKASNNEAKYEALIVCIRIALDVGARSLITYSES
ncbi:UNVERIFIED_CONTAM: hypothetical protein Scaly_2590800 [Sesamum calycinum]|uniref:Uncharacterized protein n=1 Tax=Sesamum calycinum TaxID=2727403 RepID=A0AAW2JG04_9LAMI